MVYGGMFMLAGGALIAIFYIIFKQNYPSGKADENILSGSGHLGPSQADAVRHELDLHRGRVVVSVLGQCTVSFAVVAVAAVGFGWIMAGRALSPVRPITDTARRVAGRHLGERSALQGPDDELKELADTFDALHSRPHASFD